MMHHHVGRVMHLRLERITSTVACYGITSSLYCDIIQARITVIFITNIGWMELQINLDVVTGLTQCYAKNKCYSSFPWEVTAIVCKPTFLNKEFSYRKKYCRANTVF